MFNLMTLRSDFAYVLTLLTAFAFQTVHAADEAKKDHKEFADLEELDEKALHELKILKVSHDDLVKAWKDSDYKLGMIKKGYCHACICGDSRAPQVVFVQVGTFRFGTSLGKCFYCIQLAHEADSPGDGQIRFSFKDSKDIHEVNFTLIALSELAERTEALKSLGGEATLPLTAEHAESIKDYAKKYETALEKQKKEKTLPYQCKICKKLKLKGLSSLDNARKRNEVVGICLGCSSRFSLTRGCSILTCPLCTSHTKTCLVCLRAPDSLHDLPKCSDIMKQCLEGKSTKPLLPELEICACDKDT